jgi:hypothetical protein
MSDHRIRLTDEDIALIVAALTARAAASGAIRRHRIYRLASRLAECQRGNPKWLLDLYEQTHEEQLVMGAVDDYLDGRGPDIS